MFRRPGAGRSKASADTLCQKCLKRGHYSYECKVSAQERPYASRPSRTQQLLNPKLKPKLTTEVPEDLVRKKGIADDILKKKEESRRRRSPSVSSVDSASTISTNRSPSRSPSRHHKRNGNKPRRIDDKPTGKRPRRSVSSDSRSSRNSGEQDRHTRRRMSSFSPGMRGRRRSRSESGSRLDAMIEDGVDKVVEHDRAPRARSGSRNRRRSRSARRKHGRSGRERRPRSVSQSQSPSRSLDRMDTSDDRVPPTEKTFKRPLSRSPSPYHGNRDRSPNHHARRRASPDRNGPQNGDLNGYGAGPRNGKSRFSAAPPNHREGNMSGRPPAHATPRERSLSPYSKRVALTRQMQ